MTHSGGGAAPVTFRGGAGTLFAVARELQHSLPNDDALADDYSSYGAGQRCSNHAGWLPDWTVRVNWWGLNAATN